MKGVGKFFGEEGKLIKAHIIPKRLYYKPEGTDEPLMVYSSDSPGRTEPSWTGIYDRILVCGVCEKRWDGWDSYAVDFLRNLEKHAEPIYVQGELTFYQADKYDYQKLKLFFISLAWRCGASQRPEFSLVSLGLYQDRLKEVIESKDPDCHSFVDISVFRFDDTKLGRIHLPPSGTRFEGVNYLRVHMYGYIVYVKLDKRHRPYLFQDYTMKSGQNLKIGVRPFKGSPEEKLIKEVVSGNLPSNSFKT